VLLLIYLLKVRKLFSGESMYQNNSATRRVAKLASVIVSALMVFVGLHVDMPASFATTNSEFTIKVLDSSSPPLPITGLSVDACDNFDTQEKTCVTGTTDDQGLVTLSYPLSGANQTIQFQAGGSSTNYSYYRGSITLSQGVIPATTVINLRATTWIDVSIQLVDSSNSNAPIRNESVEISATAIWGPMSFWATTNSQGIATFRIDANQFLGLNIAASVGGNNSHLVPASVPVVIVGNEGTATLSTTPLNFTLSGTVRYQGSPVSNQQMSLRFNIGQSYFCRDFETGENGVYSVSEVGNINFWIEAKSCFDFWPNPSFDNPSPSFTYVQGSNSQNLNFELSKTGISVRVTDSDNPAPNVEVTLTSVSNPSVTYRATSDNEGVALFLGLQPGSQYRASVSPSQNSMSKYQSASSEVILTAGSLGSDSSLQGLLSLTRLNSFPETPVTVTGRVVTGVNSTPLRNATVQVNWSPPNSGGGQGLNFYVKTNSNGEYTVLQLPYGQTNLTFNSTGYRRTSISTWTSQESSNTYDLGDINLRPRLSGELSFSGVLKDSEGNPIVNRKIVLSSSDDGVPKEKMTNSVDGSFSFTGMSEGAYYLFPDTWSDSLYSQLSWNYSFIDLVSNQSNVQIVLQNKTPGQASVSGYVGSFVDVVGEESAAPMQNVNVYVWPELGGQGYNTTTDSNGNWSISNLTDGQRYYVSVQYPYENFEAPQQNNVVTATNGGGEINRFLLKQVSPGTGVLTGRVKESTNYTNLSGIQVSMYRSFGGFTPEPVYTNDKGEYSFTGLPEGEYFLVIGDGYQSFKDAFMSVAIDGSENRVNAILTPLDSYEGTIDGVIRDDRGIPLPGATVQVWNPNDQTMGASAQTDAAGRYSLRGVPTNLKLNYKVTPGWDLRYEVSSDIRSIIINENDYSKVINVQLQPASYISGVVSGIPGTGNVPQVSAELVDVVSGAVISVDGVDPETGTYSLTSLPSGSYVLRFTQRANYEGYSGGGGWGWAGNSGEQISLRPVYFDGTTYGTTNRSLASVIQVDEGDRLSGKSVTLSQGSSIRGIVLVETPDGAKKLTGTRSVEVTVYKKQSSGEWEQVGYTDSANGFTNSEVNIVGLSAGTYKLKFADSRRGNNSLLTVYNGGATSLALAPEINIDESERLVISQELRAALPERSAAAFDLDDLGQVKLEELRDQISIAGDISPGTEQRIYVGIEFAGEYVSAFANSTPITLGDWKQVDSSGFIRVMIPINFVEGSHRVAVQDVNQKVIGWSEVNIYGADSENSVIEVAKPKTDAQNAISRMATSDSLDSPSTISQTLQKEKDSGVSESSQSASGAEETMEGTFKSWMIYLLAIAILLAIFGVFWFTRSRKSQ
jgi:hypothetical protein